MTDQLLIEHDEEAARLRRLQLFNRFLAASSEALLDAAGVTTGAHVIDLGCGEGAMSMAIAKRVGPQGRVYAVDHNAAKLDILNEAAQKAALANIVLVLADVQSALSQLDKADFIYSRFLLMHLPTPIDALARMRQMVRKEGKRSTILLEEPILAATGDYPDNALWPNAIALYERYCQLAGTQPNYGRALIADLKNAGATLQSANQTSAVLDPAIAREYVECSLLAARRQYIESGLLSARQFATLLGELRRIDLASIDYCRFHGVMQVIAS